VGTSFSAQREYTAALIDVSAVSVNEDHQRKEVHLFNIAKFNCPVGAITVDQIVENLQGYIPDNQDVYNSASIILLKYEDEDQLYKRILETQFFEHWDIHRKNHLLICSRKDYFQFLSDERGILKFQSTESHITYQLNHLINIDGLFGDFRSGSSSIWKTYVKRLDEVSLSFKERIISLSQKASPVTNPEMGNEEKQEIICHDFEAVSETSRLKIDVPIRRIHSASDVVSVYDPSLGALPVARSPVAPHSPERRKSTPNFSGVIKRENKAVSPSMFPPAKPRSVNDHPKDFEENRQDVSPAGQKLSSEAFLLLPKKGIERKYSEPNDESQGVQINGKGFTLYENLISNKLRQRGEDTYFSLEYNRQLLQNNVPAVLVLFRVLSRPQLSMFDKIFSRDESENNSQSEPSTLIAIKEALGDKIMGEYTGKRHNSMDNREENVTGIYLPYAQIDQLHEVIVESLWPELFKPLAAYPQFNYLVRRLKLALPCSDGKIYNVVTTWWSERYPESPYPVAGAEETSTLASFLSAGLFCREKPEDVKVKEILEEAMRSLQVEPARQTTLIFK